MTPHEATTWPTATYGEQAHMARVLELDLAIAYLRDDVDLMRDIESRAAEWGLVIRR